MEFAKLAGVSVKTLRRLDKAGMLVADRIRNNQYSYTKDHLDQLNTAREKYLHQRQIRYKKMSSDFTGCRFGQLVVVGRAEDKITPRGRRHRQWLCHCDCGNEVVVDEYGLKYGYRKSCGCLRYGDSHTKHMKAEFDRLTESEAEKILENYKVQQPTIEVKPRKKPVGVLQDLTGQKFGLWTVLERGETRHYKGGGQAVCWRCQCACGTIKTVPGRDLKSGASQSCGCLSSMSWLEYYTKMYLMEHHCGFEYQKKYNDLQGIGGKLLSYDFVVLKDDKPVCIIECQGEQHYRPIKKFGGAKQLLKQHIHDDLKKQYAEEVLKVPLYEILYTAMSKEDVYRELDKFHIV